MFHGISCNAILAEVIEIFQQQSPNADENITHPIQKILARNRPQRNPIVAKSAIPTIVSYI